MITKKQAVETRELHFSRWHDSTGQCVTLRRIGETRTPAIRGFCFRGVVKLKDYRIVDETNCHMFHTPQECPLTQE